MIQRRALSLDLHTLALIGSLVAVACVPAGGEGEGDEGEGEGDEGEGEEGEGEGDANEGEGEGEGDAGEGEGEGANLVENGSFENTTLAPGCYSNLTNEELSAALPGVFGFGAADQTDLYTDATAGCFGESSDGVFHLGLGADDTTDAVALALSAALVPGRPYVATFFASFGETGGDTSTNLQLGVSSSSSSFGTLVGETGLLPSATPQVFTVRFSPDSAATFLTMQVEVDGNLGWAMIDDVQLTRE
jgi:hypothetical protein